MEYLFSLRLRLNWNIYFYASKLTVFDTSGEIRNECQ